MNYKVGDHVCIAGGSTYYKDQAFDSFNKTRIFIIEEMDTEEYVCKSTSDGYVNVYEDEDLVKILPVLHNKRKLKF